MRLLFQSVGIFATSLAQCGNGVAAAPSVLTGHQVLRHATVAVLKISGLFLRCLVASQLRKTLQAARHEGWLSGSQAAWGQQNMQVARPARQLGFGE